MNIDSFDLNDPRGRHDAHQVLADEIWKIVHAVCVLESRYNEMRNATMHTDTKGVVANHTHLLWTLKIRLKETIRVMVLLNESIDNVERDR